MSVTENSMYNSSYHQNLELTKAEGTQLIAILGNIKINSFGSCDYVLKRNCGSMSKMQCLEDWRGGKV